MAEFDPMLPKDADEAAYAQALLGDDAGREQRRARLMAALPRPEAVAAMPVARNELAWRWQPYAWGLVATALLLAAVLILKGRPVEPPAPTIDPRLAAGPTASAPVVVAQAELPPVAAPQAPAVMAPPVAVKIVPAKPQAVPPPAIVMADASLPQQRREMQAAVTAAVESARLAVEPAPIAPAAPAIAAAPAPAPAMAAAPALPKLAEAAPPSASNQAESLARYDAAQGLASARSRMSLAASDAAPAKLLAPAEAILLAAVNHADLATARSALQAGASVHQRDPQGRTVLMLAARTGSREMVDLLLGAGARKADRDPQGWMAAEHARSLGHAELAEQLR